MKLMLNRRIRRGLIVVPLLGALIFLLGAHRNSPGVWRYRSIWRFIELIGEDLGAIEARLEALEDESTETSRGAWPIVRDAEGKSVGTFLGGDDGLVTVMLELNEARYEVRARPDGFVLGAAYLYFRSADCSGTPYLISGILSGGRDGMRSFSRRSAVGPPGFTLYEPAGDRRTGGIGERSRLSSPGVCMPVEVPSSHILGATPVREVGDLDLLHSPPFSLELE